MLRTTLAVSRRTALTASLAAATAVLLSCGGGDETGPAPMYASLDLVGSWEFVTFRTGVAVGWERGIAAIDPAGVVSLTSFTDSAGTVDPGAQQDVLSISPATGELTGRSGGVPTTFHGTLARSKKLLAAVSTPEAATYSLMFARKREVTTYSNADLRGRTFALHSLRAGADGEWRYANGSIDAEGVVSVGLVMGPAFATTIVYAPPPPHGATLSVAADGTVSDGGAFRGFLTPDKTAVVAVLTDPSGGPTSYQLTILVLTGHTFAQADLAGAWTANSIAGNVSPIWYHMPVEIDALGSGHYVAPCLDSAGGTTLPPSFVTVLASNGRMTQAVNPSYRATLSTNGELYVRTTTHNPPGRYGIGVAFRR